MGYWIHVDDLPTGGGGGGGGGGGNAGGGCGCLMFLITAGLLIANGSGLRIALVGGLLVGGVVAALFTISGPDWEEFFGVLVVLGILAAIGGLWYLNKTHGLANILVSLLSKAFLLGAAASVFGIFYILRETDFERPVILAGAAGFGASAALLFLAGFGFPGCLILAPIGAVAVMWIYVMYF